MNFASVQEAQYFLAQNPDIEMVELFILDANGVPVWWPAEEYPHQPEETLPMTG